MLTKKSNLLSSKVSKESLLQKANEFFKNKNNLFKNICSKGKLHSDSILNLCEKDQNKINRVSEIKNSVEVLKGKNIIFDQLQNNADKNKRVEENQEDDDEMLIFYDTKFNSDEIKETN